MLVFGIGAGPSVAEGAEISSQGREVGRKTGNQNCMFYEF